jgi:hypothetical protein
MTTLPRRAGRDTRSLFTSPVAIVILLALVAAVALGIAWFPRERSVAAAEAVSYPPLTEQQRADIEKWWAMQPKVDLPISNEGAKVLVHGLRQTHASPAALAKTVRGMKGVDLGGFYVDFTRPERTGSQFVEFAIVNRSGQVLQ